jgi:hypothetical protein
MKLWGNPNLKRLLAGLEAAQTPLLKETSDIHRPACSDTERDRERGRYRNRDGGRRISRDVLDSLGDDQISSPLVVRCVESAVIGTCC